MPEYRYKCTCGAERWVTHGMTVDPETRCRECDGLMWRKPQAPIAIHWASGLPPSAGEFAPAIQKHLDNVEEIREQTDEHYYERDKNKTD
jgi:DNA-directed RNA polymerase subunit RPC12/RpoP